MAIEIQVTPRRLEKIIIGCIILVILVMSPIIYNSYKHSQLAETENNVSGAVVSAGQKEEEKAKVEEVKKEEPKTETKTTTSKLSGSIDITIAPIRYQIKESATYRKAVIDTLSFIVKNGAATDLNMKVKVYHSNPKTSEDYNNNSRVTLEFDTIYAGESRTKSFRDIQGLNLYNIDLDQTLKFVFEDSDGSEIKTMTKVLKIE